MNFGYIINSVDYLKTKNFDFGLARVLVIWEPDFHFDFFAVFNSNRNVNEIIEVFNSSECTPEKYIIKDDKYNYYSLYYILYLETTKIIKEHPELKVNITELEIEYEDLFYSIVNLLSNNTVGKLTEGIFNKTTCRKKISNNEYECFIEEFKISVTMPFTLRINEINENIVDTNEIKAMKFYDLISYSITYTNPSINGKDIEILIKTKIIRTVSFYLFNIIIIFWFYIIFINILSDYFFNSINNLSDNINKIAIDEDTGKITLLINNNNNFHDNDEML